MKYLSGVSKFLVFLLMLALPAVASAPIITVTPLTPTVVPAGPGACPFDLLMAPEQGRPNSSKTIMFANSQIISGAAFVTVTNLSNFKSMNFNGSGPSQLSFVDNNLTTIIGNGPLLLFLDPTKIPPTLFTVSYTTGRVVVQLDSSSNTTSITYQGGPAQNVCELLE